ncbi:MAG: DPP IV N-terminal domain-containing protein, partial [Novosphingobium sp.]
MRHFRLLAACALSTLAFAPLAHAQQGQPMTKTSAAAVKDLTFERVFASPGLNGPAPRAVKLSPDGRYLTLLRNRADDRERYDLWGFDRTTGEWKMLVDSLKLSSGRELSEAEKMQRERQRIGDLKGIVSYEWAADGKSVLVPVDGDLLIAGLDGTVRKVEGTKGGELTPKLGPKGQHIAFVRDRRLWAGPVTGAAAVAITPEEANADVHWGEAEFVAQEEMNRFNGFWWSPDESRIAVERFDESMVGVVTRTAIGAEDTKTYAQRYPAAGTPNAEVSLYVMAPDGSGKVEVDLGKDKDIYLARVDWAPDGKTLYVQRMNREQTVLDMLKVDPMTGKSSVLFSEKAAAKHWIDLSDSYRFLKDGSLVWWSQRDGFGHLYRYKSGKWAQLTKGDWTVTGLVGVDEKSGKLYFTGTRDDVLAQQVYALDLGAPAKQTRLSELGWVNNASMDKSGQTLMITRSADAQPAQSFIADTSGKRLAWIEENKVAG